MTINIMIVDDSVVVRGLLRNIIEKNSDMSIISTAVDGEEAVKDYMKYRPHIVLLDVEMPNMNGIATLQKIRFFDAKAKIIMCSSLTQKGAETTYKALELGAMDFLAKPSSGTIDRSISFADELVMKIRGLTGTDTNSPLLAASVKPDEVITLRDMPLELPKNFPSAIVVGASTGGPRALIDFFKGLDKNILLPIFVTQHIPQGFSESLADNIHQQTGYPVQEAKQNMLVEPGHIYIAPGQRHMGVQRGVPKRIQLIDAPPVNYCRPSIDVMLESLGKSYHDNMILVMLTGMGADGKNGCAELINRGNNILLAQDRESSIVWGIPGAVAKAGLCHMIAPPAELAEKANRLIKRDL